MDESQENLQENPEENVPPTPQASGEDIQPDSGLEFNSRIDLKNLKEAVEKIKSELGKVIVGQHDMLEMLVVSILADYMDWDSGGGGDSGRFG